MKIKRKRLVKETVEKIEGVVQFVIDLATDDLAHVGVLYAEVLQEEAQSLLVLIEEGEVLMIAEEEAALTETQV